MNDYISREAATNVIEQQLDYYQMVNWKENPRVPIKVGALNWCLNTIREIPSADLRNHPVWIPCGERLPENVKKNYWVCTDMGYQCECRWTNVNHFWTELTTEWHWHIMDTPQYSKVVAWMPLPEPYKEGENND